MEVVFCCETVRMEPSEETKRRLAAKIQMCKGVNPDKLIMLETEVPLNVTITEIFQFMVKDPCPYTEKEKDSNKGMEAIFYFKNGWVKRVIGKKIDDVYVVRGEVKHSFSLNQPPLLPWVVIKDDGTVLAAHCTCAIGLLECCSHVGATLFSLDDLRANVLEKTIRYRYSSVLENRS
ncbi:uncharacterized protein LOC119769595 [Culex quinquefasciatus]|uniref:uncharacterized protein LOC119769595 n=1 Tax=Culex quinquefasciatus TaxID=7176 RepID=UPI0018E3F090|nr:uncharacterized protein LOC119769595 [Culex quinquefasciatus]